MSIMLMLKVTKFIRIFQIPQFHTLFLLVETDNRRMQDNTSRLYLCSFLSNDDYLRCNMQCYKTKKLYLMLMKISNDRIPLLFQFTKFHVYALACSPLAVKTFKSATYGFNIADKIVWFGASPTAFFVASDLLTNVALMFLSKLFSLNFISIWRIISSITSANIDLTALTSTASESVEVPAACDTVLTKSSRSLNPFLESSSNLLSDDPVRTEGLDDCLSKLTKLAN